MTLQTVQNATRRKYNRFFVVEDRQACALRFKVSNLSTPSFVYVTMAKNEWWRKWKSAWSVNAGVSYSLFPMVGHFSIGCRKMQSSLIVRPFPQTLTVLWIRWELRRRPWWFRDYLYLPPLISRSLTASFLGSTHLFFSFLFFSVCVLSHKSIFA